LDLSAGRRTASRHALHFRFSDFRSMSRAQTGRNNSSIPHPVPGTYHVLAPANLSRSGLDLFRHRTLGDPPLPAAIDTLLVPLVPTALRSDGALLILSIFAVPIARIAAAPIFLAQARRV